ncbi:extracellular solute-binding protein [Hoeflea sp. CAU 1731]
MRKVFMRFVAVITALLTFGASAFSDDSTHAIAIRGEPALSADYTHFPYANPDAPKGGRIAYGVVGTFDTLNPFIVKGVRTTARGMWDPQFGHLTYEPLMQRSKDEPFTMYGLIAESVEFDENHSWIQFNVNPKARWSDGEPITADDIIFTFELFEKKARPPYSDRLKYVTLMEKVNEMSVRFTLTENAGFEFPLILGLMPVLPEHATDVETFDQTTFAEPVTSGPYKIKEIRPGERIVFERRPDYWARDLPVKRGFDNFDEISIEYFLSDSSQFEAFKKGAFDVYMEGNPVAWDRSYDFPAVEKGEIVKKVFEEKTPAGMYGFVFNTRNPVFQNVDLRHALAMLFDFNWVNRTLFEGAYKRTESYFQGSELSSIGVPASDLEQKLLAPYSDAVAPEVIEGRYRATETDGSGRDRKIQRQAFQLLKKAGYSISDGQLVHEMGRQLSFEVMTQNLGQEKLALAYQRSLSALGIDMQIRTVDDAQYQQRTNSFDYDVIIKSYPSSLSPGVEQLGRWGSQSRDEDRSFNYAGTADPAIDAMIDALLAARGKDDFIAAARALDRVLISGHYVVPLYYLPGQRVAYQSRLDHPEETSIYGYQLPTWWDSTAN